MATVWRRIQRSHKKPSKFKFTATLKELQLSGPSQQKIPQSLAVAFMHRRRKISSKVRSWEPSFSGPEKCVLVWPEQTPESLEIVTTLYKGANDDQYDDKEWTIVVEEISKSKRRPLAAVPLNVRLFLHETPDTKSYLKILLGCQYLADGKLAFESFAATFFRDAASHASSASLLKSSAAVDLTDDVGLDLRERRGDEVKQPVKDRPASAASSGVRPPWRDGSIRAGTVTPDPIARGNIQVEPAKPFQRPTLERASNRSMSRAPGLPPPERIEGENLLHWAQRVTKDYRGVKVLDFTKSWNSGIALCAIIHAYKPYLIEDFDALDFSDTFSGRKSNVKLALARARELGLTDLPDESDIISPDSSTIRLLLEKLRRVLENAFDQPTPTALSDHRISKMYPISDDEKKIIDELEKMRLNIDSFPEPRSAASAPAGTNVASKYASQAPSTSGGVTTTSRTTVLNGHSEHGVDVADLSRRAAELPSPTVRARGASPARKEELLVRARQILKNPPPVTTTDNPELRERAKRMLDDAQSDGATFAIKRDGSTQLANGASSRSAAGSSTDLRRVGAVPVNVTIRSFKRRDPSPVLQRKEYGAPLIPAMAKPSQKLVEKGGKCGSQTSLNSTTMSSTTPTSTFDRVRRFGSMRGAELRESIAQLARIYGIADSSSAASSNEQLNATPSRMKVTTQWEIDVADEAGTAKAMVDIVERMRDLDAQAEQIKRKMGEPDLGDDEEPMLMETLQICHIEKVGIPRQRFIFEQDRLVNKQEYYNIIANIRATSAEISELQAELAERGDEDKYRTAEEKERTEELMQELVNAMSRKNDLTMRAIEAEEMIEQRAEMLRGEATRNSSTLIRKNVASNQRGTPQYSSVRQLTSSWFS